MSSRMDEFKIFVRKYPGLKEEVRSNNRTWQNIYEEWSLYGEEDNQWEAFKQIDQVEKTLRENPGILEGLNLDSLKGVVNFVQKINPDKISNTLTSLQRVVQIAQGLGGKKGPSLPSHYTNNSMYNSWWD